MEEIDKRPTTIDTSVLDGFHHADNQNLCNSINSLLEALLSNKTNSQYTQSQIFNFARVAVKELYDYAVQTLSENQYFPGNENVQELNVEDFDLELIWEKIDKFNTFLNAPCHEIFSKIKKISSIFAEDIEEAIDNSLKESLLESKYQKDQIDYGNSADLNFEDDEYKMLGKNHSELLPVEDEFLKLDEMEEFVKEAEEEAEGEAEEEALIGDEDEFDGMFKDEELSESEKSEDDEESEYGDLMQDPNKGMQIDEGGIYYKDFFKDTSSKSNKKNNKRQKNEEKGMINKSKRSYDKKSEFKVEGDLSGSDDSYTEDDMELSKHERESRAMKRKIARLEEEAVAEKAWMLKGEVSASQRPKDTALEVDADFEMRRAPPAEIIVPEEDDDTEIEALVKKRILEGKFDDVVRKPPPVTEIKGKIIEVNTEKPKEGLGEMYEKDYMQAVLGGMIDDRQKKLRNEATAIFKDICQSLDVLTHFKFTPHPIIEDGSIKVNIPSIAMEEAMPEVVAIGTTAAPEEVYVAKKRNKELKGEKEVTKEERKRLRARKKRIYAKKHQNDIKIKTSVKDKRIESSGKNKKIKFADSKVVFTNIQKEKESDKGTKKRKFEINSNTSKSINVKL